MRSRYAVLSIPAATSQNPPDSLCIGFRFPIFDPQFRGLWIRNAACSDVTWPRPAPVQPATMALKPLSRQSLNLDTVRLARHLIGRTLVREHPSGLMTGRIVETEAYPPGAAASHAF